MLQIPAIEWSELILNGDTAIGNATITNIVDTAGIAAGMVIVHPDFAYNTRVVSFDATSVTLSTNALANNTGEDFSFYFRFEFTYPASVDQGEQAKINQTKAVSLSGIQQTVTNHIELTRDLEFRFITMAQRDILRTSFYYSWAGRGKSFRYFDDKEINSLVTYTSLSSDYTQEREVKKHPDYLYKIKFKFRRAIQ